LLEDDDEICYLLNELGGTNWSTHKNNEAHDENSIAFNVSIISESKWETLYGRLGDTY